MSDDLIRPGPLSVPAGEAPNGIVVHIYRVPDCELLHVGRLTGFTTPQEAIDAITDDVTVAAVRTRDARYLCFVMYDGDSGERLSHWPDPWN